MKRMTRSIVCIMLIMLMCVGCSNNGTDKGDNESGRTAGILQEDGVDRNEYVKKLISNTATIEGADIIEGQYEEPLSFVLTDEERKALLSSLSDTEVIDPTGGSGAYYKLIFRNSNGDVLDEWIIDISGRMTAYCGRITDNPDDPDTITDSQLERWRTEMESAHDISYENVFNRKPGEHYFDNLPKIASGRVSEITENNFVEGVEYDLNEKELEKIQNLSGQFVLKDDIRKSEDLYYRISIYDDSGAELQTIDVTRDGAIIVNGWNIEWKELDDIISIIYKNSGIADK